MRGAKGIGRKLDAESCGAAAGRSSSRKALTDSLGAAMCSTSITCWRGAFEFCCTSQEARRLDRPSPEAASLGWCGQRHANNSIARRDNDDHLHCSRRITDRSHPILLCTGRHNLTFSFVYPMRNSRIEPHRQSLHIHAPPPARSRSTRKIQGFKQDFQVVATQMG